MITYFKSFVNKSFEIGVDKTHIIYYNKKYKKSQISSGKSMSKMRKRKSGELKNVLKGAFSRTAKNTEIF